MMNEFTLDIPRAFASRDHFIDPYRTYAACLNARQYVPMHWGGNALGIFGYQDARTLLFEGVLQTPRLRTFFPVPDPDLAEFATLHAWINRIILHRRGDEHRELRALIERPHSAIAIQRYEALIQEVVDARLQALSEHKSLDAVAELAAVLPTQIMGQLLGLAPEDDAAVRDAARAIAHWMDGDHRSRRETLLARDAVDQLTRHLMGALEHGRGPLLTALCARSAGTDTDIPDILAQCILSLVASQASLGHLVANTLHLAFGHSTTKAALLEGQVSASAVVDETLRFEPPVQFLHRTVKADFHGELGHLTQGTSVLICLGSAQRDAAYVANGNQFDPTRQQPPTLAFGLGDRICIGRALSKLSAVVLLSSLMKRRPALTVAGPVRWGRSFHFRGVAELKLAE